MGFEFHWRTMAPFGSKRLYVTVFEGDSDAPLDEESISVWREVFDALG